MIPACTFIAILAALLSPALKKARDSARQIPCLNNLKQIGSTAILYGADNNDYIPGEAVDNYWTVLYSTYLDKQCTLANSLLARVFVCPADKVNMAYLAGQTTVGWPCSSYGMNLSYAYYSSGFSSGKLTLRQFASVKNPAGTLFVCDKYTDQGLIDWQYPLVGAGTPNGIYAEYVPDRHGATVPVLHVDGHAASSSVMELRSAPAAPWTWQW